MTLINIADESKSTPTLIEIQQLLCDDLNSISRLISEQLISNVPVIQTISQHIINSGGKRLRPLIVLLSSKIFGYQHSNNEHHELAAVIEFVHTATLLHDDVVDASKLRRGQDTANQIWGNQASVLVGDFLYSRAFQLLTRRNNFAAMRVLAKTTNAIAEGEVTQLLYRYNPDITEAEYMEVIRRKTACLFSAAAEVGALLGNANPAQQEAIADYGLHIGIAFQIIDDLLDYTAHQNEMGKNVGDDLSEGRATLPLIYALRHCSPETSAILRDAIKEGDLSQLENVLAAMTKTNAKQYTLTIAKQHAEYAINALQGLPANPYRHAMQQLIEFVMERNY